VAFFVKIEDRRYPMETRKRRILLVRHGETEWNSAFRFQGRTDVPLSERGLSQAGLLAQRLAGVPLDKVYTSPLLRAYQTADAIVRLNEDVREATTIADLSEMSFGRWEGLRIGEIREQYPDLFSAWSSDPSSTTPPGGESFPELIARVGRVLDQVLAGEGDNLLVVCHGGTIRAFLSVLMDLPPVTAWRFRTDNCSITAIDLSPDRTTLRYVNDTLHTRVTPELAGSLPLL